MLLEISIGPQPDHYSFESAQATLDLNEKHHSEAKIPTSNPKSDRNETNGVSEAQVKPSIRKAVWSLESPKTKVNRLEQDNAKHEESSPLRTTAPPNKVQYSKLASVESVPLPDFTHTQLYFATRDAAVTDSKLRVGGQGINFNTSDNDLSIPKDDVDGRKYCQNLISAMKDIFVHKTLPFWPSNSAGLPALRASIGISTLILCAGRSWEGIAHYSL